MTIRSTPSNGGFQLSDVPFFCYYLFCLIKSFFIMTLRLRYQTLKNKLKHTGISSDIINKRSMGNLACTILRLYVLFGKERARLWRYGRFQWCALGLNSRYFHPALWAFFILLTFFLFLALPLDVWCFTTNGPPHAWVDMEYKLRKCEDMYSSLNEENLISMSIHWKEV